MAAASGLAGHLGRVQQRPSGGGRSLRQARQQPGGEQGVGLRLRARQLAHRVASRGLGDGASGGDGRRCGLGQQADEDANERARFAGRCEGFADQPRSWPRFSLDTNTTADANTAFERRSARLVGRINAKNEPMNLRIPHTRTAMSCAPAARLSLCGISLYVCACAGGGG